MSCWSSARGATASSSPVGVVLPVQHTLEYATQPSNAPRTAWLATGRQSAGRASQPESPPEPSRAQSVTIILGALGGRGLRIAVVLSTSWADVSRRSTWRLLWRLIIDEQKSSKLVATLLPRFVCTVGPALGAYNRFARHQQRGEAVRSRSRESGRGVHGCSTAKGERSGRLGLLDFI